MSDIRPLQSEPFVLDLAFSDSFVFGLDVLPLLLEQPLEEVNPY